jgi:hypothetical protein
VDAVGEMGGRAAGLYLPGKGEERITAKALEPTAR